MRFVIAVCVCLTVASASGQDFYGQWYRVKPRATYRPSPKPMPTYRKWKVMSQYGADHTVLVPAWQQSQRGAYDNVVVPNSELDYYDIVYQQEWSVPVDVTGEPLRFAR